MTRICFVWIILVGILAGCRDDRAWTTPDSWYNPPPAETYPLSGWQTLDYTKIHEVAETQQSAAEQLLQDVAVVELTFQQAADLIGQSLPDLPGTKPYLTRAVYLNRGGFSIHVKAEQLLVSHASLGHGPVPMKRQALVLQLAELPQEVFVTCSMAE